jgi:hypothetical protein
MPASADQLVALARAHEEHLLAFVRARDDIFLNPKRVKDMRLPLPEQLGHYLLSEHLSDQEVAEIERALITGEVDGDDDEDDDTEDGHLLIEHWRDDPIQAWATALMAEAKGTAGDCVLTPDGRCVGPLPVRQWLEQHVPLAVGLLQRSIAAAHTADEPLPPNVAVSQATQCAGRLATRINDELALTASGSAAALRHLLPQLVLVLDFLGELPDCWIVVESRNEALGSACTAARALADGLSGHADEDGQTMLDELRCLGFIAARLVDQDARLSMLQAAQERRLGLDIALDGAEGWNGDEEGLEQHAAALLEISVGLAGWRSSA